MDKWRRFGIGGGNAAGANGTTAPAPTESPPPEPKDKERALDESLWGLENVSFARAPTITLTC